MTEKPKATPKLTNEERHARFVEMAREVEASDKGEDFDEAFKKVTAPASPKEQDGA